MSAVVVIPFVDNLRRRGKFAGGDGLLALQRAVKKLFLLSVVRD